MEPDLKPCPFCGGTEITVTEGESFRWKFAECGCGARGPEVRVQTTGKGSPDEWQRKGESAAIAAWNQRPDSASPVTTENNNG